MRRLLVMCALLALVAQAGVAAIPETMSYQGVLTDGVGTPVPDGFYTLTFRIYTVPVGGVSLWTETQNVFVEDGIFDVILGDVNPITLLFDTQYYLSTQVGAAPALTPRTELTSASYAFRAKYADMGGGLTLPYSGSGNTAGPLFELQQNGAGETAMFLKDSTWTDIVGVGMPGTTAKLWLSSGFGWASISGGTTNRDDITIRHSDGNVGIGTSSPVYELDVSGTVDMDGFRMTPGATAGYVLTSNASGVGTWQAGAGGGVGGSGTANYLPKFTAATTLGNSIVYETGGRIGIGTTSPGSRFVIDESTSGQALEVNSSFTGTAARQVDFSREFDPGGGNDMIQIKVPSTAPGDFQFIECERGFSVEFVVDGDGRVTTDGGIVSYAPVDINGTLDVTTTTAACASFQTGYGSWTARPVYAEYTGTGTADAVAIEGVSTPTDYYGIGGKFTGGYHGVEGRVAPTGGSGYYGVYGYVWGGTGTNYGVYGSAGGTTGTAYAGYFSGNLRCTGTLQKGAGAFVIDHPLDPANKYLRHSFVESPDMMNIYNGNVVLDASGAAWIEMPEWFDALNVDFRYQLTCIGGFAPVYVAEEISGNQFAIAGGEAGMKVSWQVTGIRQDAFARANRIVVEEDKPATEIGKYVHPEALGLPTTLSIDYEKNHSDKGISEHVPPSQLEERDRTDDQ